MSTPSIGASPRIRLDHSLLMKLGAMLLALVLCMGMVPQISYAEGDAAGAQAADQTVGTATLTIVYGLGFDGSPDIKVNKKYKFTEGATLEDLYAAAKAAGDIKDYSFVDGGYGAYINSIALTDGTVVKNAADSSLYWGNFKNGEYAGGAEAQGTEVLADGVSYQFAWSSYPTAAAPSDWAAIYGAATDSTQLVGGPGAESGTATLTIVHGLKYDGSPDTVLNKKYKYVDGATFEDLLAAAKTAGDIKDYAFTGDYLSSITMNDGTVAANAADFSLSWSTYKNGAYIEDNDGKKGEALASNPTYQFAWTSYPTAVAPSDWDPIIAAATDGSEIAVGPEQPVEDDKYTPVALNSEAYIQLFSTLADAYEGTSEPWEALDLAAIGRASSADKDSLIAASKASIGTPNPTLLQKNILALTALGVDATTVTSDDGTNLIEALGTTPTATNMINGRIFALLSYKSGPYAVPAGGVTEQELLDNVLAAQHADGSFSLTGPTADADVTAMAIAALAPYRSDARVETALQNALAALRNLQLADGGFPSTGQDGIATESNVNSTAVTVIALAAAGIDPAASWAVENGATPLSALLSFANESRTGFVFGGGTNDIANEQGFRALIAYQGFKNTGAAYNVYLQAADGIAGLPGEEADIPAPVPAPKNKLAKTGDATPVAGAAVLALGALAGLALAVRKRNEAAQAEEIGR